MGRVFELSGVVVGLFSGLAGSIATLLSLSHRVQELVIDAEIDRYGYPFPWLSKTLGKPAITFEELVQQAGLSPQVDLVGFALDFVFYALAVLLIIYGFKRVKAAFSQWRTVPAVDGP